MAEEGLIQGMRQREADNLDARRQAFLEQQAAHKNQWDDISNANKAESERLANDKFALEVQQLHQNDLDERAEKENFRKNMQTSVGSIICSTLQNGGICSTKNCDILSNILGRKVNGLFSDGNGGLAMNTIDPQTGKPVTLPFGDFGFVQKAAKFLGFDPKTGAIGRSSSAFDPFGTGKRNLDDNMELARLKNNLDMKRDAVNNASREKLLGLRSNNTMLEREYKYYTDRVNAASKNLATLQKSVTSDPTAVEAAKKELADATAAVKGFGERMKSGGITFGSDGSAIDANAPAEEPSASPLNPNDPGDAAVAALTGSGTPSTQGDQPPVKATGPVPPSANKPSASDSEDGQDDQPPSGNVDENGLSRREATAKNYIQLMAQGVNNGDPKRSASDAMRFWKGYQSLGNDNSRREYMKMMFDEYYKKVGSGKGDQWAAEKASKALATYDSVQNSRFEKVLNEKEQKWVGDPQVSENISNGDFRTLVNLVKGGAGNLSLVESVNRMSRAAFPKNTDQDRMLAYRDELKAAFDELKKRYSAARKNSGF